MKPASSTRTALSAPGSAAEREADRAARSLLGGRHVRIGERPEGAGSAGGAAEALARSAGEPLAPGLRAAMEPRFGFSFGDVRIHADAEAADAAHRIGARAFAVGPHIGFAAGAYAPDRLPGRALIAHELAHVVQARGRTDVVMRDTGALTDAELQRLAEQSPIEVSDKGFHEFDDVLLAARNGLIHINDPAEFERQLRWRAARSGDRSWEKSWTDEDLLDLESASDPAKFRSEKWARFVRDLYFAYLRDKAAQWRSSTRRMNTAAFVGNVIGGVAIAGSALVGGAAILTTAGGAGAGLGSSAKFLAGRGAQAYLEKPALALAATVVYGAATPPGTPDLPGPGDDFGRALRGGAQSAERAADTAGDVIRGSGPAVRTGTEAAGDAATAARAGQGAARVSDAASERGASAFSNLFENLLRRPFNLGGTQIHVEGVGFGGVNALMRDGELVVTYSHIINTGRVPGQGRLMHEAFEQGAVQLARRMNVPSVRVAVSSVQNPKLLDHLLSLGYLREEFEIAARQWVFWFARLLRP